MVLILSCLAGLVCLHLLAPWRAWKSHKDSPHSHEEPRIPVFSVTEEESEDPQRRVTYKELAAGKAAYRGQSGLEG